MSHQHCPNCKVVHPAVNAAGERPPKNCPVCKEPLEEYTGGFRFTNLQKTEEIRVEFGDDITEDERRQVIQALGQTRTAKRTDVNDLEPPPDTVIPREALIHE